MRPNHAQDVFLAPIRDELLTPERIKRMVGEMETYYRDQPRLRTKAAAEAPRELRELEARIAGCAIGSGAETRRCAAMRICRRST